MNQARTKLKAAVFAEKLDDCVNRLEKTVQEQSNDEKGQALLDRLNQQLQEHRQRGYLTVAFVGQYSAGKSSTIASLTGRGDINIDTDIATDEVAEYHWNNIRLIDTPGLYTERTAHDATTYEALAQADLVVYTLTYALFDSVTLQDFRRLAFEKTLQPKMLLLVNKANCEAGEWDARVANYKSSLEKSLQPHSLSEFPVCFADALDYREGAEDNDEELVAESGFEAFIDALNRFVEEKGVYGQLDTPARIVLEHADEAEILFQRSDSQDGAYLQQLHQLKRRNRLQRERLRTKVRDICTRLAGEVREQGNLLASSVGEAGGGAEAASISAQEAVQQVAQQANLELEQAANNVLDELQEDFRDVLSGPLAEQFVQPLAIADQSVNARNVREDTQDLERLKGQVRTLANIGQRVGVQISEMSMNATRQAAGLSLRATQVAGSQMHGIVLKVGHLVGVKFKPWQAVNIAGKIGTAAKWLGPAAAVFSLATEIHAAVQEEQRAAQAAQARQDARAQFTGIAAELKQSFESQLKQIEAETFDRVDEDIDAASKEQQASAEGCSEAVETIREIKQDVNSLLLSLQCI